ncbi:Arm DNA-binding domain-containing protein [Desulfatibacillum aliphaticivorans]|uniref:Arm DNA-binding domain-containing protein n=1 Tax=Desulfatibacillum aliphaticivorans TaxID=218208 RepID=UPI000423DD45|nr:DUF3596 domain-containing protein [Desulfatibacillum aliphaticivorans]
MRELHTNSAQVLRFPIAETPKPKRSARKAGLNKNKQGSVRNVHGKVYADFPYFGERVRENSGLSWSEQNAKIVRKQLDRIMLAIDDGTFRFAEVFPESKKAEYFTNLEIKHLTGQMTAHDLLIRDYAWEWHRLKASTGRVSGRTLFEYKNYLELYIIPYFGEMSFGQLNAVVLEEFVAWAKERKLKGKNISNASVNKYLIPLRMICKQAAIKYNWGVLYNPFHGFKKLEEGRRRDQVVPLSLKDIRQLLKVLSPHWQPYFEFAIWSGLRPGEQIALKPSDIDWEGQRISIRRAITKDADGKRVEGPTKNKYSRRTFDLTEPMLKALRRQKKIWEVLNCEYFFCSPTGCPIRLNNLRNQVWRPALKKAKLEPRALKQTRHTFATMAISCGEDPGWIADTMGHRDLEMVIKVYTRFVKDNQGTDNGSLMVQMYRQSLESENW